MELIKNLDVKPFSRIVWISKAARERWEPIISKASQLVQELEVLSVAAGHRPCSWQTISEDQLLAYMAKILSQGLSLLPVKRVASFQGFAHKHEDPKPGQKANVCVVIGKKYSDCLEYRDAFETGDHDKQGYFLGFPKCCREFFSDVWAKGFYDPIWQVGKHSKIIGTLTVYSPNKPQEGGLRELRIQGHPFSNPMLRYIGIRIGFHIPCSFACQETIELANKRLGLTRNHPFLDDFKSLLSMPMSWDILHGIAVVRTPIFYIVTSSVPSKNQYVVRLDGNFKPDESSPGLEYPFNLIGGKNGLVLE